MKIFKFLFMLLFVCSFTNMFGQGTQATIKGVIFDENKEPVIGATITVKNESTGFKAVTITNEQGEYIIKQLPLGSPYTVSAKYVGYGDVEQKGFVLNQGDLLTVDLYFKQSNIEFEAVVLVANSLKKTMPNIGAATSISSSDLTKLPVNGRNFTSLVDLSPLSSGSQLAGQLFSSTNYTIDGMTSRSATSSGSTNRGPFSISMEAIREFEVSTNQYDVTYGRAGGGTVSTVTKSGTNTLAGSAFSYMRADWLSSPYDAKGNERTDEYSIYQYGFSLGGPIIKDRAHFFVAWDHQYDARPFYIANIKSSSDENIYNVTQTTLDRFLNIARSKYGVAGSPQIGSFDKKRNSDAVFARIDWQLNATNLLTIRDNFVRDMNNDGVGDNSRINIYEVYGSHLSQDNNLMANLRTVLSPKMINDLKVQHMYQLDDGRPNKQLPSSNIPRAIVERVASTTTDGKDVTTTIQLGGQRYLPETFKNNVFQLVDNLYYNTGKINYTYGVDIMLSNLSSLATSEMNGRFYFSGLDDFENMKPYRYAREIPLVDDPTVKQNILSAATYAQMQTELMPGLEFTGGLRVDYTNFFNKPKMNQSVYDELRLYTDNGVSSFQIQPRAQFTWDINNKKKDILKLGAGIFGSSMNNYAMINNLLNDGTKVAAVDIVGANVPTPDFELYRKDPSKAPGVELFGLPGVNKVSTINMNGSKIQVPMVYKMNFSYTHFFSERFRTSASFFGSWGRNNYMYIDANMVDKPYFRIESEDNRGVYVPANTITAKGVADWTKSRKSENIGRVLELVSEGKINQYAIVLDGTIRYAKDGELTLSYTWNDTKDNTSYNGNVANSATLSQKVKDDPRDLHEMSYSTNHFRHKIVAYGTLPSIYGFNLGVRFSGIGGTRYTLGVNGNVNGDFVNSNDLAYIYDPNSPNTPTHIKEGLNKILNDPETDQSVKNYINKYKGKMAERNGGINGFYGIFDIKLSKSFKVYKSQKVELSGEIFNLANLLNKEWGIQKSFGSTSNYNLYNITGFDQATKTYSYKVNETVGVVNPSGNMYQIQLGLKYSF